MNGNSIALETEAGSHLDPANSTPPSQFNSTDTDSKNHWPILASPAFPQQSHHLLLLLSDSALPLGSFAFSSGLESYLAHTPGPHANRTAASFQHFLALSLSSVAGTSLPYVLAAHRSPCSILGLDDEYDASLLCAVARRASVAQGRALLAVWERALRGAAEREFERSCSGGGKEEEEEEEEEEKGREALETLRRRLAVPSPSPSSHASSNNTPDLLPQQSCHFPPLWGAVTRLSRLTAYQSAYVFLLNHVKAVVSAAVRASVMGPYQAQAVLASADVQEMIMAVMQREWDTAVEDAGQTVPVLDLWGGRHELLYSRIFNS